MPLGVKNAGYLRLNTGIKNKHTINKKFTLVAAHFYDGNEDEMTQVE